MAAEIDALQLGYKIGFINDSQIWLLMLKKYNTSVYSYNEDEVDEMIVLIHDSFIPAFIVLRLKAIGCKINARHAVVCPAFNRMKQMR